jgi:hypothetical protein
LVLKQVRIFVVQALGIQALGRLMLLSISKSLYPVKPNAPKASTSLPRLRLSYFFLTSLTKWEVCFQIFGCNSPNNRLHNFDVLIYTFNAINIPIRRIITNDPPCSLYPSSSVLIFFATGKRLENFN